MQASQALSPYLFHRAPTLYGGNQADYLARAESAIQESVATIQSGLRQGADLKQLFFNVHQQLSLRRGEIAFAHSTMFAPLFGASRTNKDHPVVNEQGYVAPIKTTLAAQYAEYNQVFMNQLKVLIPKETVTSTHAQEIKREETVMGRVSSFTLKLLPVSEVQKIGWAIPIHPTILCRAAGTSKPLEKLLRSKELMQKLKTDAPKLYEMHHMGFFLNGVLPKYHKIKRLTDLVNEENPDRDGTIYAVGTLRLEIKGKLFALSRFITCLQQGTNVSSIEQLTQNSIVTIIHQDPFLIESTLHAISEMFEKALRWSHLTESKTELKNRVALLRFTYAHCMPSFRGDGAIGDWLELSIYRALGFTKTRYSHNKLACFEAITAISFSHYRAQYDNVIHVE